jgi:hypothetical protein
MRENSDTQKPQRPPPKVLRCPMLGVRFMGPAKPQQSDKQWLLTSDAMSLLCWARLLAPRWTGRPAVSWRPSKGQAAACRGGSSR